MMIIFHLPSSLLHLLEMRSSAYVSPVIMYLPVSPVAPPKMTTLDFETIMKQRVSLQLLKEEMMFSDWITLSDGVTEASQWHFAKHLYLVEHIYIDELLLINIIN